MLLCRSAASWVVRAQWDQAISVWRSQLRQNDTVCWVRRAFIVCIVPLSSLAPWLCVAYWSACIARRSGSACLGHLQIFAAAAAAARALKALAGIFFALTTHACLLPAIPSKQARASGPEENGLRGPTVQSSIQAVCIRKGLAAALSLRRLDWTHPMRAISHSLLALQSSLHVEIWPPPI